MQRARSLLAFVLVSLVTAPALARDFYVDPATGSPDGDGSESAPWRTLEEVVAAGLIETRDWDMLPWDSATGLAPVNDGAPIQAGDTIWLRSGYHGELVIEGAYNEAPITIAAAPGETPTLSHVLFRAASNWALRGVSISPTYAPEYTNQTLVDIDNHGWRGPSDHITVEDCELFSVEDTSAWAAEDWVANACNGFDVDGDDCVLRDNHLHNVHFGISVGGANALVSHNVVDAFSGDGMRGLGDGDVFEYNLVQGCYDVDENHDDGFQSWSVGEGGVGTGEVHGIVLRGNVIIDYTDPDQPLRGTLQGIGCFDGFFVDCVVENNVIITDHWHGITLLGARDSRIVNNTVIDLNDTDPGPPWIMVGPHKDGTPSSGVVVRNNLATALNIPDGQDVTEDHNMIIEDASALFVDVAANDLHLRDDAPAIDVGSAELAPALDADRIARPEGAGIDLGAYEWHTPDVGPEVDGGVIGDAGVALDAGMSDGGVTPRDASAGIDAGTGEIVEGGCGCSAIGAEREAPLALLALALLGLVLRARAIRRR